MMGEILSSSYIYKRIDENSIIRIDVINTFFHKLASERESLEDTLVLLCGEHLQRFTSRGEEQRE